ncbi:hypothetical protein [Mucilaginibacter sp.]|uniref:hypothetical protein n=1 Tax=Mucilaginibacter sp. TaxID=1882438 RepID=UPI00261FEA23|nr:hypothetical protein [Mucilaginibacter sp.]
MNEAVKVDLKISRKTILMLGSVLEHGLSSQGTDGLPGLIDVIPKDIVEELRTIAGECLQKASLTELSEKLRGLAGK